MIKSKKILNKRIESVNKTYFTKSQAGFTLMEIVVATAIFAVVVSAMMSLFNYTLKINRRSEALRQATQGMRDFVEFLVKEVRNGQVDYFVSNGNPSVSIDACRAPVSAGSDTYDRYKQNWLGIITPEGDEECIYYGKADGSQQTDGQVFEDQTGTLVIKKGGLGQVSQVLNPPNFTVQNLAFMVRPIRDPYTSPYVGIQPSVTIFIKFVVKLPTGETVPIYYQTSVSTDKYDVPNGS